jgi:hypothetical protein
MASRRQLLYESPSWPSYRWERFFRAVHSNTSFGHQTGIEVTVPYLDSGYISRSRRGILAYFGFLPQW